MAKSQPYTRVRIVKHTLPTGEIESLLTNVEDFSRDEIVELYHLRWGIETMYSSLKGKLQIEKFTSSIQQLIEQDFFSSVLAYNIIQSARNEANNQIFQDNYKYEMKINENMAIGFVKNDLLSIMLENDDSLRSALFDKLIAKICRHKIPICPNRTFPRRFKTDNINSINKLKTF